LEVIGFGAGRTPTLDPNLVAVAPFDLLTTGQELWREGLVDVLSRYLDGAGSLRSVSPTIAIRRWRGRADPASAADLGRRTRARFVVFGDLVSAGPDSVRVSLSILDAASGRRIATVGIRDVRTRMDRVADSAGVAVLRELGQIRPIGAVRNASLAAMSPEALKAFLRGEQFYRKAEWDSAIAHYERALDLDSSFAPALWHLGRAHFWRGHHVSHVYLRRAAALNRGLAPRESLLIVADSLFASLSTLPLVDYGWAQRARRLFAILQTAAERDRDDPEVWQALGEARVHFWVMPGNRMRERLALDAFDRAIALDPAFGATYRHAVQLTIRDAGAGAVRRYTRSYEALRPPYAVIDGTTLIGRLIDGPPAASVIDTLVANAPLQALEEALVFGLLFWPDTAETGVYVARAWEARARLTADSVRARRVLSLALAYRGHLREASGDLSATDPILHELVLLGAVPADSAAKVFRDWFAELTSPGDTLQFARKSYSLERSPLVLWMAARGDTAHLRQYLQTIESLGRTAPSATAGASMEYFAAAGRAYLSLGRGDTAQALRRLGTLPDSLCPVCDLEQLVRSQLLTVRGRYAEARVLLERDYNATSSPLRGLWQLQRARVAERLGKQDEAIKFYAHVAELWRHADPELQPFVAEATLALRRLRGNASH